MDNSPPPTRSIAFVGDFLPRRCGIATFTADICESMATEFPDAHCLVAAVNDRPEGYDYPSRVRFEIEESDIDSYTRAADFLNVNHVEVLSLQHEFGIFGGPAGSHILALLRSVRMPVVTTLHTVLAKPNSDQWAVMKQLNALSNRFIVMSEHGRSLLETVYNIGADKIDVIPHGIIDVPFIDPTFYKDQFNAVGKTVLLTFGLLSPNKGIEHAIAALPAILEKNPNVVYLVVGATHPNLLAHEGEAYRNKLERMVAELGLTEHVVFHNHFVTKTELMEFIGGADIYITPYLNEAQITSGTLACSFGAGKAVISTPYWHARELLDQDRGVLVPFADSPAIAEGVNRFLADPGLMAAVRKNAWELGRAMIWPVVARRFMESFEKARAGAGTPENGVAFPGPLQEAQSLTLPPMNLEHLCRMTDNTGMFQHAVYHVPNYAEGYCTDDNARAFILTLLLQEENGGLGAPRKGRVGHVPDETVARLASTYLAFLWNAFEPEGGRFRNFMSHDRRWLERAGSEDSHARALWAMGFALGRSKDEGQRHIAASLFQRGLPVVDSFASPRAWAFALLSIHEYLRMFSGDRFASHMREKLAARLVELYRAHSSEDWKWFEPTVTYDNAKLCQALISTGSETGGNEMLEIGLTSLRWLLEAQTAEEGHFTPVGCHGFWPRGEARARFDQQPLEAQAMVAACLEAFSVTGDDFWQQAALRCFEWFLGRNDLGRALYDSNTGGCCDALLQDRVNYNQGAESSLAFYLSLAEVSRPAIAQNQSRQTFAA